MTTVNKEVQTEIGQMAEIGQIVDIPPHLAVMRMENDTMQALALARPRDHESIKADLAAQMEAYPAFAAEAIYSKPVGRDQGGQMKYARGLSIRAAEAVAEAYGYCRVRSDVTPVDDDTVRVEATFTDFQKGRIWSSAGLVSKFYRSRGGSMTRIADDRFYSVTVKAEESRRIREVILRSVPPGLRAELMSMAERKIDELLDDSTVEKIVGQFSSKGVDLETLERYVGRTREAGWTKQDRVDLLGIWNAVADGESTVTEVFGDVMIQRVEPVADQEGVTADDLTGTSGDEPKKAKSKSVTKSTKRRAKGKGNGKQASADEEREKALRLIDGANSLKGLRAVSEVIQDMLETGSLGKSHTETVMDRYATREASLSTDQKYEKFGDDESLF